MKVKPKNPVVFALFSGWYGTTLPAYFRVTGEKENDKGSVSLQVEDPREEVTLMKRQWFNQVHFVEVK
jgi:hypothetical protein